MEREVHPEAALLERQSGWDRSSANRLDRKVSRETMDIKRISDYLEERWVT